MIGRKIFGNVDSYKELANAVVTLACEDYRDYKKHFQENEDIRVYIKSKMEALKESGGEHYEELIKLQVVMDDVELDQRTLQSKIREIEKFLVSPYGMLLSRGLGDVILEKICSEKDCEGDALRGELLFNKRLRKMEKRLERFLGKSKEATENV